MKDILKITFVIIGSLIGAGFASGQEIYVFFYSHGFNGIIGIIISSSLIGIVIYKTLKILERNNIYTYKEFLDVIIKSKKQNVRTLINFIVNLFILVTFFIMISGFGAYFEQQIGVNKIIGSIILAILCFIIFMTNIKGVIKVNGIIVPILIIFIIWVGIKMLGIINIVELKKYTLNTSNNWRYILESILYSSYNSILLIPVIITLKNYISKKKIIKYIAILTTIIVSILAMIIYLILAKVDINIQYLEMPAVYVVSKLSNILEIIYGFIILSSIFTTAISLGNTFLQNICINKKHYPQIALIMCITSIIISQIGFSNLIYILYPIFGYLGLIQIFKIIRQKNEV